MSFPTRPGNLSVETCISSAAVSTLTLLISAHLSLALFARAFPNRHRQYVSHESAIRPLARRFRLLFFASVITIVDSFNHMVFFGSLWLLHEADPLLYRAIYVMTSSITSPLIVFAIVHRCIFIVGQNCPKRRRRLLVVTFLLCLGVSIVVGTSGSEIILSLLDAGPPRDHAELWSTSPFVSNKVSFVIIILPVLVVGSSIWSLAYLVRTSNQAGGPEQEPQVPRISMMSAASNGTTASSVQDPSQNTLADSGNHLNSTTCHIHAQSSIHTTVLPSIDGDDMQDAPQMPGVVRASRSAEVLTKPLAAHLSKMVSRATSASTSMSSSSKPHPTADASAVVSKTSATPSQLSHQSAHAAPPSQQLAYPLSRSFIVLTTLLSVFWISVLYIASRGAFVGPVRSATLMSLLGILGCWADASFESLARVAAKRQNNQTLDTVSAHFSLFSTIRHTLSRAMGGGTSRRTSEAAEAARRASAMAGTHTRPAQQPTVLRSAPTCPREDDGKHERGGAGGSPPGVSFLYSLGSSRKGSVQPSESSRKGSVVMVTVPRKANGKGGGMI